MSKIIRTLVIVLFISGSSLYGKGLNWRTWEAALNEAASTNKIIMIDAVKEGCRYCTRMDENVFHDAQMAEYIEKRFVPVKINISHESMPMGIRVQMTPSFYFFDADMRLLKMIPGSWNKEDFREFLDKITLE